MNSNNYVIQLEGASKDFHISGLKTAMHYIKHVVGISSEKRVIKALDVVNIGIKRGEKVGLVGLNGAGKSTLIKCVTGILRLTSGRSMLFGRDSYKYRIKNNLGIGVVFGQRCQLRWDLSPMESYRLLAAMYNISPARRDKNISELSELLGLDEFINQPVRSLSLGQRMRSELVAAFLHDPQLVLLDEPTLGLDLIVKEQIQKLLKESDKTIFVSSHDVSDIENVCDRIIILHKGRVLFDDRRERLSEALKIRGRAIFEFVNEEVQYNAASFAKDEVELLRTGPHKAEFALRNSRCLPPLISNLLNSNGLIDVKWIDNDLRQVIRHFYGDLNGCN